jgi:hypothetical protein
VADGELNPFVGGAISSSRPPAIFSVTRRARCSRARRNNSLPLVSRLVLGQDPAQCSPVLGGDRVPQPCRIPQRPNLPVPRVHRLRLEGLARSGQQSVQTGQLYHVIVATIGQDAVEARLLLDRVSVTVYETTFPTCL